MILGIQGSLAAVRRPISGHRGIGGGQLLVLLTEMKRYLLDTKRVGTVQVRPRESRGRAAQEQGADTEMKTLQAFEIKRKIKRILQTKKKTRTRFE
ncbi:hypothetical protein NC651_026219 [Populus alba x Populus x berolinensis]|nr:hypothetical protein NC651_026219 [Populus alba x Populus x berolinensis]